VQELTGINSGENTIRVVKTPGKIPSPLNGKSPGENTVLIMPARAKDNRRVYAYLTKTRGLPGDLVGELVKTGLIYQDGRGNCVFPCLDAAGQAHGAILRGTLSDVRFQGRAPGSDTSYGWWWPPAGKSDLVTVTESPIDAMSLAVLKPGARAGHILALGGLHWEAVEGFLRRVKIARVVLALDSDIPGRRAASEWSEWLSKEGYRVWNLVPPECAKDWNEALILVLDTSTII
jgi:hypothetical protein